jgi:uncharacterized membrane-anchored protein YhcB (DUF1043 family)
MEHLHLEHSDDAFAQRLRVLTRLLILKLDEKLVENEQENRIYDLDQYRKDLAEANPESAHRFEQMTADERKQYLNQIAMAESVAYAVLWAMDHLPEHPH